MEPRKLFRDQRTVTVGTSDIILVGPQRKRVGTIIGSPKIEGANDLSTRTFTSAASTASTGIKSTLAVPAGQTVTLIGATMLGTTGTTQVCALQVVEGGTTFNLAQFTGSGTFNTPIIVPGGDTIQWNCTTAIAASVTDFTISIARPTDVIRVTLSFVGVAVLDNGLQLHAGNPPIMLTEEFLGSAIKEEIHAIGSIAGLLVSVTDLLES